MKYFVKLSLATLFIFITAVSCDIIDDSGDDAETDPESLEFSIEPTEDLSFVVNEAPEDFTWDYFNDNMIVNAVPGSMWSGEIALSSFKVENGEIVNQATSEPVETSTEALSEGLSTEELFPGSEWVPGPMWLSGSQWFPGSEWIPGMNWSQSEIQEIALNEVNLSENQTMVVVYVQLADNSSEAEVSSQPYGVIFDEQQSSTGSLEVTTETGGTNRDEEYQVAINDQSEIIGANETITISELPVGDHEAELTDISDNCSVVNGENPRTVTVNENQTTAATFEVNCAEALSNQVAFTSFRDGNANIHVIGAEGSGVQQLTTDAEFDGQAAISPNGTKIAFTSNRDGNREIYVMNSDGSGLTRLTNNSVLDEFPAWSPDGTQLVFSSQRDGVDNIYTMNTDGSNVTQITTDLEADSHPSWSPDGNTIAFQTLRDGDWTIYSINTDGSDATLLTDIDAQSDRDPVYSPDGSQIAYSSVTDTGEQIFVMESDGTNHTQITNSESRDIFPTWSPNGDFIGFQSDREGGNNIHIIGSDGSSPSRLTMSGGFDESPNWSPVE